mmetsp:Transcript_13676/g.25804  ORF Transcript_13676/g.25804 Transcript_13676/m.25804 type:complete len:313 (-) Transcript_13676:2235-3173(-)
MALMKIIRTMNTSNLRLLQIFMQSFLTRLFLVKRPRLLEPFTPMIFSSTIRMLDETSEESLTSLIFICSINNFFLFINSFSDDADRSDFRGASPSSSCTSSVGMLPNPSKRMARKRFRQTKLPMKIQKRKYRALAYPAEDLIPLYSKSGQFSRVKIWNTVMKASKNESKLERGLPSGKSNAPPKVCMPTRLKMTMKRSKSRAKYVTPERVEEITRMISAIDSILRNNRATRKTRNALKTRRALIAVMLLFPLKKMNSIKEKSTTAASRKFIESAAYPANPSPKSLRLSSMVKMIVKAKFVVCKSLLSWSEIP